MGSKNTDIDELELAIRENCEPMLDKSIKDVSLSEVIINLFDTARKFKLEVQPQLVLMQKTLLYTEGLGREFYPERFVENIKTNFRKMDA